MVLAQVHRDPLQGQGKEREKGVWGRRERETKSGKVEEPETRVVPGTRSGVEPESGSGSSAVAKAKPGTFPAAEMVLRKLTTGQPQRWLRKPFCLAAARWQELKSVVVSLANPATHKQGHRRLHRTGRFGYTYLDSSPTATRQEDHHDHDLILFVNPRQGRKIEV